MEREPVRVFLDSVLESRMEARRIRRKLDSLESRALNVTAKLSGMPRGGGSDRDALLVALTDAADEYYRRLAAAEQQELRVMRFIDSIDRRDYRIILRLRYIDRKPWSKILATLNAEGVGIKESWMYKLHGKALAAAREKYREVSSNDESRDP